MSNLSKEFLRGFFVALLAFVLFLSNPAFAYSLAEQSSSDYYSNVSFAESTPGEPLLLGTGTTGTGGTGTGTTGTSGTGTGATGTGTTGTGSTTPITPLGSIVPDYNSSSTVAPGTCSVSKLSPMEAKGIMDLTHEGFSGGSINDGKDTNNGKARDIGDTELVGKDLDGKQAVKATAPNYAASADRFSFLNGRTLLGPFGIGLIMDDTIRVGRCAGLSQEKCLINGQGLFVRTSGVGFKSDMVNAFESIKDTGKSIAEMTLSKADTNKMKSAYLDINSKDFLTGSFGSGDQLKNSILTNQYTAKNATTCNNSACVISTYSAFDKYFNSWMTTTMVVSTFGPMLIGKSHKLLTQAYKSFGDSKNSPILKIPQKIRDTVTGWTSPMSKFGYARDGRFKALMQEEGIGNLIEQKLVINKALWSSGAKGEIMNLTDPSSPIWKFPPEKRKKLFEAVEHLNAYARASSEGLIDAQNTYYAAAKAADGIADPVVKEAAKKAAKKQFAQRAAVDLDDWDEVLALDFEDWAKANQDLFSFGGYAVKKNGTWANDTGYVDISSGAPFNFKRVVQQYGGDGDWSAWANSADAETFHVAGDGVSLQLYKIQPKNVIAQDIGLQDLHYHLSKMGNSTYSIKFPDGTYRPLNEASIRYIEADPLLPGHVSIFESGYVPADPLTPDDFANRITDKRIIGRPNTATRNTDGLKNALIQNNYAPRNYTSALDQQFAAEGDMIKNYFKTPSTAILKGTVYPIMYWNAKKGFGNEDYSAFLLPDTWSTISIGQGTEKIYADSFVDFYANEGSDQGDMFKRTFNSALVYWNKIIEMAAETNQFVKDGLSKFSGGFFEGSGSMRDTVGDLAFYSHNENCSGCFVPIKYLDNYLVLDGFSAPVVMQAFMLEASTPEEKTKTGSTIISYTHHSDLKGKTGQVEGEAFNIANARTEGKTCDQKLREFNLGWAGNSAGGVLAFAESAVYFFGGLGPGLMASLTLQMKVGAELQDCVDDVEGYYVHFYSPPEKEAAKNKSASTLSNEKVSETLAGMGESINAFVKEKESAGATATNSSSSTSTVVATKSANPIENSMDKLKSQFDQFSQKAKQANILQASLELKAPSSGVVRGKDVFYVWFKDQAMPSAYITKGKSVITDGNMSLEEDYENGTLKLNGKTIIGPDKADHVRLITQDNRFPAKVVPMTLNKIAAPMDESIVFQMNTYGEIKVLNRQVLDCIQKAVMDQVGIEYSGDELTQVFGSLKQLSTENYGSVFARDGKIYLEGTSPRAQGEEGSKFIVNGYWNTKLTMDTNGGGINTGKFVGMTFEHGTIVLKPETNELVIWLRQHKDSVLTNQDVKGLNAKLTSVKDPETECELPAIDLEAIPNLGDELGGKKVENFNKSMDKLGPFTQFVTDKKIYEFYAKRDGNTGDCKNYFRVRDKATGKILSDQEIIGGVKQDPDGTLRFKTADGKENTLKFDAENGVPKVSYNGGPKETLLSAQGPNGSFWYDPEKGLWYPENGLQIPLDQRYKDNGAWFGADANGNVTGTPENKMTFNVGQQGSGGFSLPSVPENAAGLVIFISMFLAISFLLTQGRRTGSKRRNN